MTAPTLEAPARDTGAVVTKSDQAMASSAHSRVNIALNLENWKALGDDIQQLLLWFHQHALDAKLSLKECGEALDYDESTIFRVLKGTYEGNWKNIGAAIGSYRKLVESRGTIQQNEFVETPATKAIFTGLDYALANNSITLIVAESGQGKSVSARAWKTLNNHGRAVLVIAPAYGGTKALLRDIAAAIGVNRNLNAVQMHESILRGFNRNRILIVDEAHRLLPGDRRTNPANLEILRDIHDRTGCALALVATARFQNELQKSEYMFEQLIGRIGLSIRLPRKTTEAHLDPIVRQYVTRPGKGLMETLVDVANKPGRLRMVVETLKVASRIARKKGEKLTEDHVLKALKIREEMQGENLYAK